MNADEYQKGVAGSNHHRIQSHPVNILAVIMVPVVGELIPNVQKNYKDAGEPDGKPDDVDKRE